RWKLAIPWSIAAVIALIAGVAIWSLTRLEPRPIARFAMVLPPTEQLTGTGRHAVAFSADGTHLVYSANNQLYLRAMDQLEAMPIRGTEGRARSPFFSPDGQWVGFWEGDGKLMKVSISGGAPVTLCEAGNPYGASWGPDDRIVFGQGSEGIWQVPATGGTKQLLISVDATKDESAHGPQILPGEKAMLFTLRSGGVSWDDAQILVESLQTGERKVLINGGRDARYVPTGHLLYAQAGTLLAVPFDLARLEVTGGPVPIIEDVSQATSTGAAQFSFSGLGSLIYVPGGLSSEPEGTLVWVDRVRRVEPIVEKPLLFPRYPRLSPDGRRLALTTGPGDAGDLWVYDLAGRPPYPLAFEGHNDRAVWTPDSKRVAFGSTRAGPGNLFWIPADGSTLDPESLLTSPNRQLPRCWSPDGRELIFLQTSPDGNDIMALPIEGEREPRLVLRTEYPVTPNEGGAGAALSPDGRWLAYVSGVTGGPEIWVRPYPGPGAPSRISPNGGLEPVWGPKGREIFYLEGDKMMAVKIETDPEFRFEPPEVLFEESYLNTNRPSYDVGPDGRFLMIQRVEQTEEASAPTQLIIVQNWFEELKRLVPTAK
ncbi:hypothetical protein MYX65_10525, partial [Acidobacteria bacterium AH-259-L09]|nr:hypothetical protein [Acidobacteria bacterium AH-259-L09]